MTTITVSPEIQVRREKATMAALERFHKFWHLARGLKCDTLKCEHPWRP